MSDTLTRMSCPLCGGRGHFPLTRNADGRFGCPSCVEETPATPKSTSSTGLVACFPTHGARIESPMAYRKTIAELDSISRHRALTDEESLRLEQAILEERRAAKRKFRREPKWASVEDETAIAMRRSGKTYESIARRVGRTSDAVYSRLRFLGCRRATG